MIAKWTAAAMVLAATQISAQAKTADHVPGRTKAFVSYCADHFADCKDTIQAADIATMSSKLFANKAASACIIPKGIGQEKATKDILAWLGKHKQADAQKTTDGIQAAIKGLWHCQLQIGDGSEPGGPPAKTGAFVAYCAAHYTSCADEMVTVAVSVMVPDPPKHCSPPDTLSTKETTLAVLGWLQQHTETYRLDTDDGITAAFDQLWPCH